VTSFSGVAWLVAAAMSPHLPPQPDAAQASVENVYWVADCVIGRTPREAGVVLGTVPGGADSLLALFHTSIGPCLVAEHPLARPELYLRGAIAERLIARDFATGPAVPRHRPATVFAPLTLDQLGRMGEVSRRLLAVLDMASCVAGREPVKVQAVFQTVRASAGERAAIEALTPAISGCLAQGQSFEMTPPLLRAFLAEGAYRVAAGQPNVYEEAR
jgi:hypothetical protein